MFGDIGHKKSIMIDIDSYYFVLYNYSHIANPVLPESV